MKRLILFATFFAISFSGWGQLKIPTEQFQGLLQKKKYASLFNEARKLREKEYGKCPMVDYFIGKSLCGMGKTDLAMVWYSNILKNYKGMSAPQKNLISGAKSSCGAEARGSGGAGSERVLDVSAYVSAVNAEGPSAGVSGKLGRVSRPCESAPQPVSVITPISTEEMESRLFKIDQQDAAVAKYRSLLNDPNYKVIAKGRFILITYESSTMNDEDAEAVSRKLEQAYKFFVSNFGLRPPDKLLAVYLLPERSSNSSGDEPNLLQQTAERVHGIRIPDENIGYSNIRDLSLLGLASSSKIGTLFHELMHLMIRTDIGDVPPWMDEGLACIYETCIIRGETLSGNLDNWRTSVLEEEIYKEESKIPHLKDFLNYSWSKFDGIDDNDICKTAVNYAYAKHLILFLEQQDQLKPIFNALKNRAVFFGSNSVDLRTDVGIFETTLGMNIDAIEQKFDEWMVSQYSFSLYHLDSSLQSETFLETWSTYSRKAKSTLAGLEQDDENRERCEAINSKLRDLKSRYDNLNPASNMPAGEVQQEVQEPVMQQMQQLRPPGGNGLSEDHLTIARREKKLPGIEELKQELQEVVKQYEGISQK